MVTETGCLRGNAGTTGKNSTEYREYICSDGLRILIGGLVTEFLTFFDFLTLRSSLAVSQNG